MKKEQSQNDFYTRKAKESGYPARSIFKLKEIDEKFKIFKKGDRVLDLGSAPGSWLLYLSAKVGENGK
ncbi:50S rRNA methyltransferase, partial [Candidatus Gribaldobacteria bacterium]|nr:50S rRNA methyltransferase [Candidatus Gribaldobacteria bacterium]